MTLLCTYQPAGTHCSGGPTTGARALMSWYLGAYGPRGARNLGIYNCRRIAGTTTYSLHAEGRATDLGLPVGQHPAWAQTLANALIEHSAQLGVQCIIYNQKTWSSAHCNDGWRTYEGSNPHTDHMHVELSRESADSLTVQKITSVLKPAIPATIRRGSTGPVVARAQALLASAGFVPKGSQKSGGSWDGIFGPGTDAAVRAFQRKAKITVDGVVGPVTWAKLIG